MLCIAAFWFSGIVTANDTMDFGNLSESDLEDYNAFEELGENLGGDTWISGYINEEDTFSAGLPNATIKVVFDDGSCLKARTDGLGFFSLSASKKPCKIILMKRGYRTKRLSLKPEDSGNPLVASLTRGAHAIAKPSGLKSPVDYPRKRLGYGDDCTKYSSVCQGQGLKFSHTGVDFSCNAATSIYAANDGTVVAIGSFQDKDWGEYIVLQHTDSSSNRYCTVYLHVVPVATLKNKCVVVKKGDLIGTVADLSKKYGNHLHFSIYDGAYVKLKTTRGGLPDKICSELYSDEIWSKNKFLNPESYLTCQ